MRIDHIKDAAPSPLAPSPLAPSSSSPSPSLPPAATGGAPLESRDLVPATANAPLMAKGAPEKTKKLETISKPDGHSGRLSGVAAVQVRNVSPREMGNIAMDLYVSGVLSWDEYSMLAFQPELHPKYDATVGALTGESASPDQPRDFVNQWEDRLKFERRHNPGDRPLIRRTGRIVQVLRQIENPTDITI